MGDLQLMHSEVSSVDRLNIQANLLSILTDTSVAVVLLAKGHRFPEASFVMRWILAKGKFKLTS